MTYLRALSQKLRALSVLMVALLLALMTASCGNLDDPYVGTWMGLAEIGGGNSKLYEYEIERDSDGTYSLSVIQYDYEVNINHSQAHWRATAPHFFVGQLNSKGELMTTIGVLKADVSNFRLIYGNIFLTRKAKNTEVKLKYVIRSEVEQRYPGIRIVD